VLRRASGEHPTVRLCGPRENPSTGRTIVDGLTLSLLLLAIFCAESFDAARETIVSLRETPSVPDRAATEAAPDWLPMTWAIVATVGGLLGAYVACRVILIVEGLSQGQVSRHRLIRFLHRRLSWWAYGALVVWILWQATGVAVIAGEDLPGWIGFALHCVAIGAAITAAGAGGAVMGDATSAWQRASVVRLQLVFLLMLFLLVFRAPFTSDQLTDVLRAWGDESQSRAIAGIAAALLLGAACRASAVRLLVPTADDPTARWPQAARSAVQGARQAHERVANRRMAQPVLVGAATCALLLLGLEATAFLVLGAALIAWVTEPQTPPSPDPDHESERRRLRRLAGTLGVAPLAILLVGLVSAAVGSLLLPSGPSGADKALFAWTAVVVVLFGLLAARAHAASGVPTELDKKIPGWVFGGVGLGSALVVLWKPTFGAWLLFGFAGMLAFKAFGERGARELWGGWGVALGTAVAVCFEPIEASRAFGAFGVALFGATGILAALHIAGSVALRRRTRYRLRGRERSAPVVLLLVAWVAVACASAPERSHQARTVATKERAIELDAAVEAWLDARAVPSKGKDPPEYVPMLLVAASGGGSKAAYWADLVLDCIIGKGAPSMDTDECGKSDRAPQRFKHLFLTSSVSGGSIGIHHMVNHRHDVGRDTLWVNKTAGREILSPVVAWGMFHDLPSFLLGIHTDPGRCARRLGCPLNADRALVQEAAIGVPADGRATAIDDGLLEQSGPITVFNGSVNWGPRRVVLSRVALAHAPSASGCPGAGSERLAGVIDGHDLLVAEDVPLVTAAMLSARFPVLEPAGRLGDRKDATGTDGCKLPPQHAVKVRDGGLVENTGLLTIVDLLPAIQQAIDGWKRKREAERASVDVRLIVVSIDDDVLGVAGDNEYSRGILRVLLQVLDLENPGDRSVRSRRRLKSCEFPGGAYRRISPTPHVGAQAATGWEISQTSRREDLGESLRTGLPGDVVNEIRDMLDGVKPTGCGSSGN
jgi:hypothetical protein